MQLKLYPFSYIQITLPYCLYIKEVRGNNLAPKFVLFCQTPLNTNTRFAMQTGYYIGKNGKSMNAWNNANNRCTSKKLYSKDGFVPIGVGNMEPS